MYHIISLLYVFNTCIVFLVYFLTLLSLKTKISHFLAVIFRYSTRLFVTQKTRFFVKINVLSRLWKIPISFKTSKKVFNHVFVRKKHYLFVFNSKIFFSFQKDQNFGFLWGMKFFWRKSKYPQKTFFRERIFCVT